MAVWTLFQGLEKDSEMGLRFEYMGAAEYEFGSAVSALRVMATDLPAPKETITTSIVIKKDDTPLAYMTGPRRNQTQKAYKADLAKLNNIQEMLDGQPLLFRHVPGLSPVEGMEAIQSLTDLSREQVNNKNGMMRANTEAWLTLYPVVGILYHPSKEELVNTFVEKYTALAAEQLPDPTERARVALKNLRENLSDSFDRDGYVTAIAALDDTPRP